MAHHKAYPAVVGLEKDAHKADITHGEHNPMLSAYVAVTKTVPFKAR